MDDEASGSDKPPESSRTWFSRLSAIASASGTILNKGFQKGLEHVSQQSAAPEARDQLTRDKLQKQLLDAWLAPNTDIDNIEPLKYEAFPADDHDVIRLVYLLPGKDWEPIRINLEKASLDVSYEALSYCWGDRRSLSQITCNDEQLSVTRNLKSALRNLRQSDTVRVLWIDAICINQDDVQERNEQVKRMGQIYSNATQTVSWLCEEDYGTVSAFKVIQRMYDLYNDQWADGKLDVLALTHGEELQTDLDHRSDPSDDELILLFRLIKLPYFRRIWVVQEIALAQDVVLQCGRMEMDWDTFYSGCTLVSIILAQSESVKSRANTFGIIIGLENTRTVAQTKAALEVPPTDHLLSLLKDFRGSDATDARDKLFALAGLLHSSFEDLGVTISYEATAQEVYQQFAESYMKHCDTLDILSVQRSYTALAESLPSWIPDWSDTREVADTFFRREFLDDPPTAFNASAKSRPSQPILVSGHRLTLSGYQIDSIRTLSAEIPAPSYEVETMEDLVTAWSETGKSLSTVFDYTKSALKTMLGQCDALIEIDKMVLGSGSEPASEAYPPTGETMEEALMRTLVGDYMPYGHDHCLQSMRKYRRQRWATEMLRKVNLDRIPKLKGPLGVASIFMLGSSKLQPFENMIGVALGRKLAKTVNAHIGLVPSETRMGDEIWLIKGCRTPLVLRRIEKSQGARELLGDAYVHGIMYGEVWQEDRCVNVDLL